MDISANLQHIDSLGDDRVSLYTDYNEPQLYHCNEPGPGVFIAETPMVIERALSCGAVPVSFFVESSALSNDDVKHVLEMAGDVPVFEARLSVINSITGFNLTRGLLAAFTRPEEPDVDSILKDKKRIVVLEDIVNPTNVGAIFRCAAALGIDGILLTRGCTDPYYRRSARVSMGSVFMIPWTYIPKGSDFIPMLHDNGFSVISMALSDNATDINDPMLFGDPKRALVFGSEGDGLSEATLANSDHIATIPMKNGVDSLNVAAASAIAIWELCK